MSEGSSSDMGHATDWDEIRALSRQIQEGASLELNVKTYNLLSRTAQQVAIRAQDAEKALLSLPTATTLLREIHQRIADGSRRFSRARSRAYELRDKGDLDGARQFLRDALAVEVVPFYREQAELALETLTGLAEVLASGRLKPDLPDRPQLTVLAQRLQQGHALELTDDLCALLRRLAPTAAIGETTTEEALLSVEGTAALMEMVLSRFRESQHRFLQSMYRMTRLRDAGDLEGARQQLRDLLAVEEVPQYRQMAEEQLRGLDSLPSGM